MVAASACWQHQHRWQKRGGSLSLRDVCPAPQQQIQEHRLHRDDGSHGGGGVAAIIAATVAASRAAAAAAGPDGGKYRAASGRGDARSCGRRHTQV